MEETKELEVKQNAALQTEVNDWGLDESVDTQDIIIPKILCMQGLSKAVAEEKAQMGEFIDSLTFEILGSAREKDAKPVEIIPLKMFKTWVKYEKIGDKLDFKGIFPVTKENADWQWEEETPEGTYRNDQCLNFYVLLAEEAEDIVESMPYLVTFRRTSYSNGKKLATHFAKCQRAAQLGKVIPPASKTWMLTGTKTTNDHGTFYVMDVEPGGKTTDDALTTAKSWVKTMRTANIKVDDSDLHDGERSPVDVDVDEEVF